MSVSLDPSINALVAQAQAMQQSTVRSLAQIKAFKGAMSTQEDLVMTLISSAGLMTYDQNGSAQIVPSVGTQINTTA